MSFFSPSQHKIITSSYKLKKTTIFHCLNIHPKIKKKIKSEILNEVVPCNPQIVCVTYTSKKIKIS